MDDSIESTRTAAAASSPAESSVPEAEAREFGRLLASLKRPATAVALAQQLVEGWKPHAANIEAQTQALINPAQFHWKVRRASAWSLGLAELSPEQKQEAATALIPAIYGINPGFSRIAKCILNSLAFAVPPAGLAAFLLSEMNVDFSGLWFLVWIVGVVAPSVLYVPLAVALDDMRADRVRADCVTALGRLRIPSSMPVLLDALYSDVSIMVSAAKRILPSALQCLMPEHYGQIPGLTPRLCGALLTEDTSLRRALIIALWRVGDGRAVEFLERLLRSIGTDDSDLIEMVLVVLRERQRSEKDSSLLLRPSERHDMDDLLRPAVSTEAQEAQSLLRPAADS